MSRSTALRKTFCFASGELCHLDDQQIENIPYLSALVSAADGLPSIRDHLGFYQLDSRIQSTHFAFVLKSFSFAGVRQIFTNLSKRIDALSVIDLYDFLGLPLTDIATFEDIDLTFFSTTVYRPLQGEYVEKISEFALQDMAVRFAIALAQESYDVTNPDVIDQIYWFVMFILSAYDYFGPRLRHHVHRIAEYFFLLHSPAHVEPLARVMEQANKGQITVLDSVNEDFGLYEDNTLAVAAESNVVSYLEGPLLVVKHGPVRKKYISHLDRGFDYFRWIRNDSGDPWDWKLEQVLKPIYTEVTNIMYERLQYQINKQLSGFFRPDVPGTITDSHFRSVLNDLFHHPLVKNDIDAHALLQLRKFCLLYTSPSPRD